MDVTNPYKFIGFGAMDVTKPYKFIGFGAMDVTKPYKFIGFGAMCGCSLWGLLWPVFGSAAGEATDITSTTGIAQIPAVLMVKIKIKIKCPSGFGPESAQNHRFP